MKKSTLLFTIILYLTSIHYVFAQHIMVNLIGGDICRATGDGKFSIYGNTGGSSHVCTDDKNNIYFNDDMYSMFPIIRKMSSTTGLVSTVAGTETSGYFFGYDTVATAVNLFNLYDFCSDRFGNLYITFSNRIARIDCATDIITSIATPDSSGFSGDGGPASAARFSGITGIAVDSIGNIYVSDYYNYRIRKIDAVTGIIKTVAGNGIPGNAGDGGLATNASIHPGSVRVDRAGNIFIVDSSRLFIREVTTAGIIKTIAGPGGTSHNDGGIATSAYLNQVLDYSTDFNGNLYLAVGDHAVREVNTTTDTINIVAGNYTMGYNGDGKNALLETITTYGIGCDTRDNIYISDLNACRLRKIIKLTHKPSFAFGNGQTITPCPGYSCPLNKHLEITDLDYGQTETWSVASLPAHGTLTGFPTTASSHGNDSLSIPNGVAYVPSTTFTGIDTFRIRVSDGIYSDTVLFFANVRIDTPPILRISSIDTSICFGRAFEVTAQDLLPIEYERPSGTWSITNNRLIIDTSSGYVLDVNPVSIGIDTIIYTMAECGMTSILTVNIHPVVSVGPIIGIDSVCAGSTVTLSDTTPGGHWTVANPPFATVSSSGVVTGIASSLPYSESIIYTVSNGWCRTSVSMPFKVHAPVSRNTIYSWQFCADSTLANFYNFESGGSWYLTNSNMLMDTFFNSPASSEAMVYMVHLGWDTLIYYNVNECGAGTDTLRLLALTIPNPGIITGQHIVCAGSTVTLSETVAGGYWRVTNSNITMVNDSGVFAGHNVGTFDTIKYFVDSNTCQSSAKYVMTVDTMISLSPIIGADSFCVGSTITFSDTVTGGNWTSSNPHTDISSAGILTASVSGVTTIIYKDSNICGVSMVTKSVIIDTLAQLDAIEGADTLCFGSTLILTDAVAGGNWHTTNINTAINYAGVLFADSIGITTVSYQITNYCGLSAVYKTIIIDSCKTGIQTPENFTGITLYPNPAGNKIILQGAQNCKVVITNLLGINVLSFSTGSEKNTNMDINYLLPGIYFVEIANNTLGVRYILKMIKE